MSNGYQSAEQIERRIERERAGLSDTINSLQDKVSIDGIVRQLAGSLGDNGGEIAQSISAAVKSNPLALTLTGVGVAWLIMGNGASSQSSGQGQWQNAPRPAPYGGGRADTQSSVGHNPGAAAQAALHGSYGYISRRSAQPPSWIDGNRHNGGEAGDTGSSSTDASSSLDHAAAKGVSAAKQAGKTVTDAAKSARDALYAGTEEMSEEARARVTEARLKAVAARDAAMHQLHKVKGNTQDFVADQPLVAGALAVALGAAVAAALPRTELEDAYLGEQSDAAIAEAERIFDEEAEKLGKVAKVARGEALKAAKALKAEADDQVPDKDVVDTVKRKAAEKGEQVVDAVIDEADKQNLGRS